MHLFKWHITCCFIFIFGKIRECFPDLPSKGAPDDTDV